MHRTDSPTTKNYVTPNVNSSELRNPTLVCLQFELGLKFHDLEFQRSGYTAVNLSYVWKDYYFKSSRESRHNLAYPGTPSLNFKAIC